MTPTGNLRIVLDNVTVQVELHFCGMEGRARGGQLVDDGKFSIAFLTDAPLRKIANVRLIFD
jgi:hypothetical protein